MAYKRIDGELLQGYWKEVTQEKRTGRFLFLFPTEWWQTVKTETISSDIHCTVDRLEEIDAVYVNGVRFVREITNVTGVE